MWRFARPPVVEISGPDRISILAELVVPEGQRSPSPQTVQQILLAGFEALAAKVDRNKPLRRAEYPAGSAIPEELRQYFPHSMIADLSFVDDTTVEYHDHYVDLIPIGKAAVPLASVLLYDPPRVAAS